MTIENTSVTAQAGASAQGATTYPQRVEYGHDAKGNIVLPQGAPFDGEPVLIKLGSGWVEARWEDHDKMTDSGFGWVVLDDALGFTELGDAQEWSPLPGVLAERPPTTNEEAVDRLAQWLHDEVEFPDQFPGFAWPQSDTDTGQRGPDAWAKLLPTYAVEGFRSLARRMLTQLPQRPSPAETATSMAIAGAGGTPGAIKRTLQEEAPDLGAKMRAEALRRSQPATSPASTGDISREELGRAIRDACNQLHPGSAIISSDGVNRIYHSGLSIMDLAGAVLDHLGRRSLTGWQPIKTAPQDGRPILGYSNEGVSYVCWYQGNVGWVFFQNHKGDRFWFEPTHWMPLPSLPSTDSQPSKSTGKVCAYHDGCPSDGPVCHLCQHLQP